MSSTDTCILSSHTEAKSTRAGFDPLAGAFPKAERVALRRALSLLEIDKKRFTLSVLFGSGAVGSGVGLGAVSAWLIARAAQLPPVLDLSVAATSVRVFGIGKALFRYLQRISSHWVALRGMAAVRTPCTHASLTLPPMWFLRCGGAICSPALAQTWMSSATWW